MKIDLVTAIPNNKGKASNVVAIPETVLVTYRQSGGKPKQACFRIDEVVMRNCRWVIGDVVSLSLVRVDGVLAIMFERGASGYKLSAAKTSVGKIALSHVRTSNDDAKAAVANWIGSSFRPHYHGTGFVLILDQKHKA